MPEIVGTREAKAHLSALVARARRGEVITIVDGGRPVARLVPMPDEELPLSDRLRQLETIGWVTPDSSGKVSALRPATLVDNDVAQRYLREDRDGR